LVNIIEKGVVVRVTKITIQSEFSRRLYSEFQRVGLPMYSPTEITRILNRKALSSRVTTQAVRKWLYHGVFPSQDKLINLASWLGVSAEWLRYGVEKNTQHLLQLQEQIPTDYNLATPSMIMQELSQLPEARLIQLLEVIQQMLRTQSIHIINTNEAATIIITKTHHQENQG
jgi:hypothetical protein